MLPYQQHLCCVAWGSLCPHYAYIQDNFVQWRKKRRRKKHHLILSIWYTLIQSVLHFEIKSFKFLLWSVTGHILRLVPLNEYHADSSHFISRMYREVRIDCMLRSSKGAMGSILSAEYSHMCTKSERKNAFQMAVSEVVFFPSPNWV